MQIRITKYGITLAPGQAVTTMLLGVLNGWSYDYRNPLNQLRDRSLQIRNVAADALTQYKQQLQRELAELRKNLPEPTRENPYPSMDGLQAVKELEVYIRKVETLQTRIQTASIPPQEFVYHGRQDNENMLKDLYELDVKLVQGLAQIDEEVLTQIEQVLKVREGILKQLVIT